MELLSEILCMLGTYHCRNSERTLTSIDDLPNGRLFADFLSLTDYHTFSAFTARPHLQELEGPSHFPNGG